MRVKSLERQATPEGMRITFITPDTLEAEELFQCLGEKPLEAKFKAQSGKRSLDANGYLWSLCSQIAEKTKLCRDDVYRHAIKKCGVYTDVAMLDKAVKPFINGWERRGVGCFAEVFPSKLSGCQRIRIYFGTSEYDSKQFSKVLDYVVDEAKSLHIPTLKDVPLEWIS